MRTTDLLQKLFDLERSIGVDTDSTILNKIIEVEEIVLSMQQEKAETFRMVSTLSGPANKLVSR